MDLRAVEYRKLRLTVSRRPPERMELIERAIEGFSATQRTRMLERVPEVSRTQLGADIDAKSTYLQRCTCEKNGKPKRCTLTLDSESLDRTRRVGQARVEEIRTPRTSNSLLTFYKTVSI